MQPAPPLDPAALASRFADSGRAAGFRVETYGNVEGYPLMALTRRVPGPRPRIYISTGIHGDEPAPVQALLQLIETGHFDDRAVWLLCPLINPAGLAAGTRENAAGIDLNRDYLNPKSPEIRAHTRWLGRQPAFDVSLCLHEDWEAKGFYLYELNPTSRPSRAQAILDSVAPICPIDQATSIDGREAKAGIIRPVADPLLRETWPEAIYLSAHHTTLSYTLETPSGRPIKERVDAHCAAVLSAITGSLANSPLG